MRDPDRVSPRVRQRHLPPWAGSLLIVLLLSLGGSTAAAPPEPWREAFDALVGEGACLVARLDGTPVLARNASTPLPPASTLKVLTSLVALDELGPDFRFATTITLSAAGDLCVRGEGDPFLVSEEWERIADEVHGKGLTHANRILLDQSFFRKSLAVPGVGASTNPYDAVNRALSANFNTVGWVMKKGLCLPIEPQTPVTACARKIAREIGTRGGETRVSFVPGERDCPLYPGELLEAFLEKRGVRIQGPIEEVSDGKGCVGDPWLAHRSSKALNEVIEGMLDYSNNFIANQVLLVLGARRFGEPATLEKGVRVIEDYVSGHFRFQDPHAIEEGSGIARGNRISARDLMQVLLRFEPKRSLMREENGVRFKTGSLTGVSNLVGFFPGRDGEDLAFVVFLKAGIAERKNALALLLRNLGSQRTDGSR